MYIVINCLGMPFNGDTIKTKSLGGSESAAYYMARELAASGHHVTMFTAHQEGGEFDGVKYIWAGQPTEDAPLGGNFHYYAQNTPHDVLIIQRHPHAFNFNYASKVNLWWLHDLATLQTKYTVQQMLWNVDGIITVSEFHKKQVCDIWEIDESIVHPVINAVDGSLFDVEVEKEPNALIYISRPERGLEHLVKPGGIMERLPEHKLYVCGYDNTVPQMREYYEYLWQRCEELPNVINLGHLTKAALAQKMKSCEALVYPTPGPAQPNFEEVSCIAVMEAMHAGIGIVTTHAGALVETCGPMSNVVHCAMAEGQPDLDDFVQVIKGRKWEKPEEKENPYTWLNACSQLEAVIQKQFKGRNADIGRYLIDVSDIVAFEAHHRITYQGEKPKDLISIESDRELFECYRFYLENDYANHYTNYYEYEKARGINYGPEDLTHNLRFEHICNVLRDIPDCRVVGDYGCAHGHYTINLAKRFPSKRFFGYDIALSNIEKAKAWAEQEGITNVEFFVFDALNEQPENYLYNGHDALLVCEVLEHVTDPRELIDALAPAVKTFICSTPFGPWEGIGYKEHWPWRAHLHHFERADIAELYGHLKNFFLATVPSGTDKFGRQIGSFVYSFQVDKPLGEIDYARKIAQTVPWQTLSLCMIVKDAADTIEHCLKSCKDLIHEAVIGIDCKTTDQTRKRMDAFFKANHIPAKIFDIKSPLDIGFDAARNEVIKEASGSWIMWLDADETLTHPHNLPKYLRHNEYNGYALPQHHLSFDPPGVLKTDLPVKVFRNFKDIKFVGLVHEHPEQEMNKGVGNVFVLPDVSVGHIGYPDEGVRRGRFARNIALLERDRKTYPERWLGKFLYLRDLSQMCSYDAEQGNPVHRDEIKRRVETGIQLWLELFDARDERGNSQLRLVLDGLPFYSNLCQVSGDFVRFSVNLDINKRGKTELKPEHAINACFKNREHFDKLVNAIIDEKSKHFDCKYA